MLKIRFLPQLLACGLDDKVS